MKIAFLLLGCIIFAINGCGAASGPDESIMKKIEIDLSVLDENGLRGAGDGKTSVSYEFCIPDNDAYKAEVKRIDESIQFCPGSKGRIGAGQGECLCIGDTHRKDYHQVLEKLAGLSYVKRIIECYFE
jgi:hypothetical protein